MIRKYTQIDWERVIIMLCPPVLRKQKQLLWLQVLLKPLTSIYEETLYRMQHNAQVVYLEKVLNEQFNKERTYSYFDTTNEKAVKGLIFIDDADRPQVQYLYTHEEIDNGLPAIITFTQNPEEERSFRNFLYLASDLDLSSTEYFNFRINIPVDILENNESLQNQLRGLDAVAMTVQEKQRMTEAMNDKLIFEEGHPFSSHPDAVNIKTPQFHKEVNFYKVVSRSYETRKYVVPTATTQNEQDTLMIL